MLAVAAGVDMLLALFPALVALVSLYGLFSDPSAINEHLSLLQGVLPEGMIGIIREQVTRLSQTSHGALSMGFLIGFAVALWTRPSSMLSMSSTMREKHEASCHHRAVTSQNGKATFKAADSRFSKAIFCASMQSPAAKFPFGTKHFPLSRLPLAPSSLTFRYLP